MIIQSIKPIQLQPQYLIKKECKCYLLHNLDSATERECRGFYIKTHHKQEYCIWQMKEDGSFYKLRIIRPKKLL